MSRDSENAAANYDRIAGEYADRLFDELEHKPFDREILVRFADESRDFPVCDLGCGPGHVARFLRGFGADVLGLDVSKGMVAEARRRNPDIEFRVGDMLDLDLGGGSLGGVAALYSIIHIPREDVPRAVGEVHRVLRPGGIFLVSFHVGDETRHIEEMWGKDVALDFHFFRTEDVEGVLTEAGFEVVDATERNPYGEDVEVQTRRAYIFARKPGG